MGELNMLVPCVTDSKMCPRCNLAKSPAEYYTNASTRDGLGCYCMDCDKENARKFYHRYKHRHVEKKHKYYHDTRNSRRAAKLLNGAMLRARKKGVPFRLSIEEKKDIQERIDRGVCEATGIKFDMGAKKGWRSPSIDRVVPALGYIHSNIRVVLDAFNAARGTWGEEILFQMVDAARLRQSLSGSRCEGSILA